MPEEYLNLVEAAKFSGVSRVKLWRMVKAGRVPVYADPRDGRVKLVKRDELEAALRPVPLAVEAPEGKAAA